MPLQRVIGSLSATETAAAAAGGRVGTLGAACGKLCCNNQLAAAAASLPTALYGETRVDRRRHDQTIALPVAAQRVTVKSFEVYQQTVQLVHRCCRCMSAVGRS